MPVSIRKVNGFQVRTPNQVHAKNTSLRNAQAQKRIIEAADRSPSTKALMRKK